MTNTFTCFIYFHFGLVLSIQLCIVEVLKLLFIDMSVFIAILEIYDYFLERKVGFSCCLINSNLNMLVKPVFLYTILNMCFFFLHLHPQSVFVFMQIDANC